MISDSPTRCPECGAFGEVVDTRPGGPLTARRSGSKLLRELGRVLGDLPWRRRRLRCLAAPEHRWTTMEVRAIDLLARLTGEHR